MDEVNVTLEKYAILCALMADTGGDIQKENDIELAKGDRLARLILERD